MSTRVCQSCGKEYARRYTETAARFLARRYCSDPCFQEERRGRPVVTRPLIPRERVAAILRRELSRYDGAAVVGGFCDRDGRQSNMAAHIARTTGKSQANVDRRISLILTGSRIASPRTGLRNVPDVTPETVEWLLDGLERPDVWHVELADWTRLLAAFAEKQLTLAEYQQQSALYNLFAKAETAAVSTQSPAAASDRRKVAA